MIHTIIPHFHHSEGSEDQLGASNNNSRNFLEIISLALHNCPSTYMKYAELSDQTISANSVDIESYTLFDADLTILLSLPPWTISSRPDNLNDKSKFYQNHVGLRSPPII
jgi:hypothetical protein